MNFKGELIKLVSNRPFYKSLTGYKTDKISYDKLVQRGKDNNRSVKLTSDEKQRVSNLWRDLIPSIAVRFGWNFYEQIKALKDFDERYLPSAWYFPYIFEQLNNPKHVSILAHKGLHKFFFKDITQPRTLAVSISGIIYDENYHQLSIDEVFRLCGGDKMHYKACM